MKDPYPVENIKRLCVFMFQTWDKSALHWFTVLFSLADYCLQGVYYIEGSAQIDFTLLDSLIVSSLKHKNTQPLYIFNRENPQNSEPQNGPRRGLDFIAFLYLDHRCHFTFMYLLSSKYLPYLHLCISSKELFNFTFTAGTWKGKQIWGAISMTL
jgi:hypothetical protein